MSSFLTCVLFSLRVSYLHLKERGVLLHLYLSGHGVRFQVRLMANLDAGPRGGSLEHDSVQNPSSISVSFLVSVEQTSGVFRGGAHCRRALSMRNVVPSTTRISGVPGHQGRTNQGRWLNDRVTRFSTSVCGGCRKGKCGMGEDASWPWLVGITRTRASMPPGCL